MDFPPDTLPLFVYGSLRPDMPMWHLISDDVVDIAPATILGRLWWHRLLEYPLLTIGGADDHAIRGEWVALRPSDAVRRVIVDDELLYGYDARWVRVVVADDENGERETDSIVLVWNRNDDLGPEIDSGDYVVGVAEATARRGRPHPPAIQRRTP